VSLTSPTTLFQSVTTIKTGGGSVDFHTLRSTFATGLIKQGVQPSYLQRLMRHADIKTTNEYYIDLRIHDLDGAVNQLPVLQVTAVEQRATGTDGQGFDCSQNCSQTVHETVQSGANTREVHGRNKATNKNINPAKMRGYAGQCDALLKAGEAIRTPDFHVGNVTLYH